MSASLLNCRREDFTEAAKEVITTIVFAMLPFWLGALVLVLTTRGSAGKYANEFLSSGEILLSSAALIGPVIYVITKKYGELPSSWTIHFPQGWFYVFVSVAICVITAGIFGLQRMYSQLVPQPSETPLFDASSMTIFSIMIFCVTVASLYLVTVLRNYIDTGASVEMRSQEKAFLRQWRRR